MNTQPTQQATAKPCKYLDLADYTIPVLDFRIGRFGGIALMDSDERPGPIVAKLPPGRQVGKQHVDHIVSIWRQRHDLAPLDVYQTAHEIEVVEATLHSNVTDDSTDDTDNTFVTRERSDLLDKIDAIIASQCGLDDPLYVLPDASLTDDLGADNLDLVEILWAVEKLIKCELNDNTFAQWRTVEDIYQCAQTTVDNDNGPDCEDGEWAYGWALRCGKGPACWRCEGKGQHICIPVLDSPYTMDCNHCHGSGVIGYQRKPKEQ